MPAAKRHTAPRVCTAPCCTVEIPRGKLMCRPHWYELPRILRTEINAAWRERRIRDWSGLCLEARGLLAGVAVNILESTKS
ncbi:MAG TPA: hypothetical protein VFO80_11805 [Sphingomonas sp.]|nr:hypothetical protein [Sphingomonas sp.]